jgi:hypothetical protein
MAVADSPGPLLPEGPRTAPSIPRSTRRSGAPSAASSSARSCPMSTSGMRPRSFPRPLPHGLGRGPPAARFSRGAWRRADRSVLRHRQGRGDGAPWQRRAERRPEQPHDRLAADRGAGAGMDEAQGPARGPGRREEQRACHHRAVGRLGRRQPQDHGAPRG